MMTAEQTALRFIHAAYATKMLSTMLQRDWISKENIAQLEQKNEALKEQVGNAEGVRRDDIITTKAEKQKTIDSLKQDLQFCQNQILHKDWVIKQCKAKQAHTFWFSFIGFVLYLLLFDLPYPDAGLIRSEAFHEILEIIGNAR